MDYISGKRVGYQSCYYMSSDDRTKMSKLEGGKITGMRRPVNTPSYSPATWMHNMPTARGHVAAHANKGHISSVMK